MTATLLAVIPLALFGVVALLGFAGCVLNTQGDDFGKGPDTPPPPTDPYDDLIKNESSLVAYWTLTDAMGAMTAKEEKSGLDGTYQNGFGMTDYNSDTISAAASGNVTAGQPGIVPGDALDGVEDTSARFDGGIVFRKWEGAINMLPPFSVEAWVAPDKMSWQDATKPALRGVIASNQTGTYQGFGLFATTGNPLPSDNLWSFSLGVGSKPVAATAPIDSNLGVHHLVGTFDDKGVGRLYVNGSPAGIIDLTSMGLTYQPLPDGAPLFIGAGLPQQGTSSPPLFPLVGNVQCVAIYASGSLPTTVTVRVFRVTADYVPE